MSSKISSQQEKDIVQLYLDSKNPSSYGSVKQFHQYLASEYGINIKFSHLRKILKEYVPGLTLDREVQLKFSRRVLLSPGIDYSWSADLAFFPAPILRSMRRAGFLVVVDNLTLYTWIQSVHSTKSAEVSRVFEQILINSHRAPGILITDQVCVCVCVCKCHYALNFFTNFIRVPNLLVHQWLRF